jgi:hypothetical protein
LGTDDIYLDAAPAYLDEASKTIIDNQSSTLDPVCASTTDVFCQNVKQFQIEVFKESKNLSNLLKSLRQYYKEA